MSPNDWIEYKNLIMSRLDDIDKLEEEIVTIRVQLAILTTKLVLITASVSLGTSAVATAVITHLLKGGV
jgi:hypothetical protein